MKTLAPRSPFALVIAAALAGFATAAGAAEIEFTYHSSELGNPEALYERMAERAEAACETGGRRPLWVQRADDACAADLLDEFVAGAASPTLTALHDRSVRDRLAELR
jgi:UrcA family protein